MNLAQELDREGRKDSLLENEAGSFVWRSGWKWVTFFLAITLLTTLHDWRFSSDPEAWKIRGDLTNYTLAAAKVEAAGGNPYDTGELEGRRYKYLPLNLMAVAPLRFMPVPLAQGMWIGLNVTLLLLALQAHQELFGRRFGRGAWIFMLLICGRLIWDNINLGQWNLPVYNVTVIGLWLTLARRRTWPGALVLGLGVLKFMPVFFTVYFLAKRQWKAAGALALAVIFWVVIAPTLWFGPARHLDLLNKWLDQGSSRLESMVSNKVLVGHSLFTATQSYLNPEIIVKYGHNQARTIAVAHLSREQAKLAAGVLCGLIVALTLALYWRAGSDVSPGPALLTELGMMFMLLLICSPQARMAHLITTVTAALALGGVWIMPRQSLAMRRTACGVLAAALLMIVLTSSFFEKMIPHALLDLLPWLSLPTLMIVTFHVALCGIRWKWMQEEEG
ncbi:DUF2029 domain-containing protein [Candidatus Sumerlaeota bacterium]|nr:DUF2029 domain-containing protein [Candidatus Sumerlaeota bacterium]